MALQLLPLVTVCLGALVWTWRLRVLARQRVDTDSSASPPPTVSIIVPARNEAHNLPALLASLAQLSPPAHELIVVDDHSTDGTGAIARGAGAIVVTPQPLPPGWLGKPWACHAGARAATGELLLFTDADTVHAPDSLGRAVAKLQRSGAELLSVVPTHAVVQVWERLQGIFQLLLLIACRAGSETRHGERRFSIGQYLLFTRAGYDRVGGHVAVRARVAEDLAFARLVADHGRFALLLAPGLMTVRMYPEGFGGFVRGWRRNFREGMASAGLAGVLEIGLVIGWLLGIPLFVAEAAIVGANGWLLFWIAAYALTAVEVARQQRILGRFGAWSAGLYPVFVVVFAMISGLALFDRLRRAPVTWKSRTISTNGIE